MTDPHNPSMACDFCGNSEGTYWLYGVCRCRNERDCMRRNPFPWQRIIEDRKKASLSYKFLDAVEAVINE